MEITDEEKQNTLSRKTFTILHEARGRYMKSERYGFIDPISANIFRDAHAFPYMNLCFDGPVTVSGSHPLSK